MSPPSLQGTAQERFRKSDQNVLACPSLTLSVVFHEQNMLCNVLSMRVRAARGILARPVSCIVMHARQATRN